MGYRHGIYSREVPTSLNPPTIIDGNSGLVVAFGTAPVHLATNPAKANTPILTYYYNEAVSQLGYSDDYDKYTLCEVMQSQFVLFGVSPVVFVNVFDPTKHYTEKTFTAEGIANTPANLGVEAILGTLKITSGEDKDPDVLTKDTDYSVATETAVDEIDSDVSTTTTTLQILSVENVTNDTIIYSYKKSDDTDTAITAARVVEVGTEIELPSDTVLSTVQVISGGSEKQTLTADEDYNAARDSDGAVVVTLITDTKVVDDTIAIEYHEADPSKVTMFDIVGGVDTMTGETTGLELIEYIYPRLGVLPGIIIAPKYSTNTAVAAVMKAKAKLINETFKATAIVDIDTGDALSYTQAASVKATNNLVDTSLFVCYPKVSLGGVQYHLSTQMAALINQVDTANGGIPYVSPSNHNLQCDGTVRKDGSEMYMSLPQGNYLNSNGIVTAINHAGGWRLWGSRTSAYPTNSDVKDNFIPIRRMFNYISNSLILSFWSKIDNPLNKRLIENAVTSANIWLDSLTAAGVLLGARVAFLATENTTADIMDGILRFHLYMTPPPPAREIEWIQEYDPSYISGLFGGE